MKMRRISWFAGISFLTLVTAVSQADSTADGEKADKPAEDAIYQVGDTGQKIVDLVLRAEAVGFSGAVLAAKDGKVIAAVAVGDADLAGKIPNTPATLFEIASATKPFTAAAVMRLAQDGKLQLDDPIAKHLPGVPANCDKITIRHLLQHTSGIPGTNTDGRGTDFGKVVSSFLKGGPNSIPGEKHEYWNQGYSLLSEVIARASGKSYVDYCKAALLTPAGMTTTRFTGDATPAGITVAVGRPASGAPRSALDHPYGKEYGYQYRGMGGLVTSVWDLWRFDRALHCNALLSQESKAELFRPGANGYALGWNVLKNQRGRLVQSHSGSVRGFICEIRRYPEENGCLFVLSNRNSAPVFRVANAVEEMLFGDPATIKTIPQLLGSALLKSIAGTYKDNQGAILTIKAEGKTASVQIAWGAKGPVTHTVLGVDENGDLVLYEWTEATKITIDRDGDSPVKKVQILKRSFSRTR